MQRATVEKVKEYIEAKPRSLSIIDESLVKAEFARVRARVPQVTGLLLSTADGRALASDLQVGGLDARRLAAMANSYLTLGETLSKEMNLSVAEYATICTSLGNVVLFRIDTVRPLTLTAMAGSDTTLALLLVTARECAARLRTAQMVS